MCRIAGIVDRSNSQLEKDIMSMREVMRHGGPDDAGIYINQSRGIAFGHRRLSLIDLSAAGHQPMQRDNVRIIFNGEIYNFPELRQQLQAKGRTFTSNSDTEVIIRAYQEWGTDCFDKLRGMFALAIYDEAKNELILARDHAGIKPLYYYLQGKKLYFASEIRAFKSLNYWKDHPDWQIYFLTYGFLPEPITTLENVRPLEKGSFLVVQLDSLESRHQYYYQETFQSTITNIDEAKSLIHTTLTKAVQRHLISDAPIGLFLSGGIDSSLLTLLAQPFVPNSLHTLSLIFADQQFSEEIFQQIIIEKTGARHQSFLVGKKDFDDSFDDIIRSMDQPSTDGINSYFICKYAKRAGLKAVLSGLGADELLGGYPSFKRARHYNNLKNIPGFVLAMAGSVSEDKYRKFSFLQRKDPVGEYLFYRGYYIPSETSRLLGCTVEHVNNVLRNIKVPAAVSKLAPGNRASYLESNLYMQHQLLKDTDAMSMWHSVEVRVPFLGRDFLDAVHRISSSLKFDHAQGKYLLIESFKDLLPREIWDRKKQGFVLPFSAWMKGKELPGGVGDDQVISTLHQRFNQNKLAWSRYWAYLLTNLAKSDRQKTERLDENRQTQPKNNILFLNLTTFSQAGGIEKFNKCFLKALIEIEHDGNVHVSGMSPYDSLTDERYFPNARYKGLRGRKLTFIYESVRKASDYDIIILGHLNLAPVGHLIKKFYPQKKIILITHGIEVWEPLGRMKRNMLHSADVVLSVSNFTKQKLIDIQRVSQDKITVFPNTIDPYFPVPQNFGSGNRIRNRYSIDSNDPVLFTLSRLSGTEKYKGYDMVINCLPELKKKFPSIRYIIGGKYDSEEKNRIDQLIKKLDLAENVIVTGYLSEKDLLEYYQAADLFIMPSRKEGFGIVFLEALICGLPVIAGNQDGSVDALRNGELGTLVDPTDHHQIIAGISKVLLNREQVTEEYSKAMQKKTIEYFGFNQYKRRLADVLV